MYGDLLALFMTMTMNAIFEILHEDFASNSIGSYWKEMRGRRRARWLLTIIYVVVGLLDNNNLPPSILFRSSEIFEFHETPWP